MPQVRADRGCGAALALLAAVLASCVHLPPELEDEFEPAATAAEDNYRPGER